MRVLGETFRLFLFVNREAAARLQRARLHVMFSTVPHRTDNKARRRERRRILAAIGDTICLRQTGASCSS